MRLVIRQVQVPDITEIRYQEVHVLPGCGAARQRQKVPHQARVPSIPGSLQLEFQQVPETCAVKLLAECRAECKEQSSLGCFLCGHEIEGEDRECLFPVRSGNMFIPQLGKSVISRHEKVVARYGSGGIIRHSLARDRLRVFVPKMLCFWCQCPPRLQSPMVQSCLI